MEDEKTKTCSERGNEHEHECVPPPWLGFREKKSG